MSASPDVITEPSAWDRSGRGKMIQFFATDEEVRRWLAEGLDPLYAPYFVTFTAEQNRGGTQSINLDPFLRAKDAFKGAHRFWIGSQSLSGKLRELPLPSPWEPLFAVNGLLLLSHGDVFNERFDSSALAISDRFRNESSGELLKHDDYLQIYRGLEKRIRGDLRYATISQLSAAEEEDDRLVLMTEGAKRASDSGLPFTSRPGRRLDSG
jgi:hypothetical protein